jgi:hypothetical protein
MSCSYYLVQYREALVNAVIVRFNIMFKITVKKYCTHKYTCSFNSALSLKGTVQRKLTGVLSGINRQLVISQSVAWYYYLNLKGLGPLNLNKCFLAA